MEVRCIFFVFSPFMQAPLYKKLFFTLRKSRSRSQNQFSDFFKCDVRTKKFVIFIRNVINYSLSGKMFKEFFYEKSCRDNERIISILTSHALKALNIEF